MPYAAGSFKQFPANLAMKNFTFKTGSPQVQTMRFGGDTRNFGSDGNFQGGYIIKSDSSTKNVPDGTIRFGNGPMTVRNFTYGTDGGGFMVKSNPQNVGETVKISYGSNPSGAVRSGGATFYSEGAPGSNVKYFNSSKSFAVPGQAYEYFYPGRNITYTTNGTNPSQMKASNITYITKTGGARGSFGGIPAGYVSRDMSGFGGAVPGGYIKNVSYSGEGAMMMPQTIRYGSAGYPVDFLMQNMTFGSGSGGGITGRNITYRVSSPSSSSRTVVSPQEFFGSGSAASASSSSFVLNPQFYDIQNGNSQIKNIKYSSGKYMLLSYIFFHQKSEIVAKFKRRI